ncbi:MAG: ABC transporter substrate-binding protein [Acidimicrobiales bacterium]
MSSRSTRAALVKLLAVLMGFALFAASCGDDGGGANTDNSEPDGTTAPGETQPPGTANPDVAQGEELAVDDPANAVRGGTLKIAVEAETDGLNPTANNFATPAYIMGYPMFDPLFYVDTDGNWFPYLAESAEPIGDGSSWQVTLRQGVKFHDGTDLNAEALAANFEAVLNDPIISLAVKPSYPETDRYEIIDEYTIQYNLIRPSQYFPINLSSQLGMVASPTWLAAAADNEALDQEPVGTGPFKFESREVGNVTKMVRNDDYWQGTDNIFLDSIEVYPITDTTIAAERVGRGELDMIVTSNPDANLTLRTWGSPPSPTSTAPRTT